MLSRVNCRSYITSAEAGEVVASSHNDHADSSAGSHEEKAFGTAPQIHNFGQRNVTSSSDAISYEIDDTQQ
jgi:hypothetical protein